MPENLTSTFPVGRGLKEQPDFRPIATTRADSRMARLDRVARCPSAAFHIISVIPARRLPQQSGGITRLPSATLVALTDSHLPLSLATLPSPSVSPILELQ